MLSSIVYTSNSGYTRQYAELLARKTGLPAYNIKKVIPPAIRGTDVLFMGWLMAGSVQGLKQAQKLFTVKCLCAVGMAGPEAGQGIEVQQKTGITPTFYLQGGFDMEKLSGIYKLMMQVMRKKILGDLKKVPQSNWTPQQQDLYNMCTSGMNCVSEAQLDHVLDWYHSLG